jgi:hypothetical protein
MVRPFRLNFRISAEVRGLDTGAPLFLRGCCFRRLALFLRRRCRRYLAKRALRGVRFKIFHWYFCPKVLVNRLRREVFQRRTDAKYGIEESAF